MDHNASGDAAKAVEGRGRTTPPLPRIIVRGSFVIRPPACFRTCFFYQNVNVLFAVG